MLSAIITMFAGKSPAKEAKNQLRMTRLALLEARGALEHFQAEVAKLEAREARLAAHVSDDERQYQREAQASMAAAI
ncbi:hypothetical protein ISF73_11255 [Burkholderia pseudomallei]|nr:hypothetical protein [Burkholderia pseudomallei]